MVGHRSCMQLLKVYYHRRSISFKYIKDGSIHRTGENNIPTTHELNKRILWVAEPTIHITLH
jgi:hypothetical protein